jgi:uncharacterized protein (DUF2141 family)
LRSRARIGIAIALILCPLEGHAATPMAASLRVTIDGAKADGGSVEVGLYDEATFPLIPDRPLFRQKADAKAAAVVEFTRLPPGAYAVKAFQDKNGNGRPDPGEPAGISNDAAATDFDAASIALMPGANAMAVHLR